MLANIRAHSLMVGRVAGLIGQGLVRTGRTISLELIVSGALLHDIAKTQALGRQDLRHDELGREICLRHGLVELAEIVAEHVILKEGLPELCAEKEIVYYADKRVLYDEIVPLAVRRDDIIRRYGNGDEGLQAKIRQNFVQAQSVEARLFSQLDFSPDQVGERLKGYGFLLEALES